MTRVEDNDDFLIQPDPDKLDLHHRRQLSAMLDGELLTDQARFMLRRLQHDAELAGCWDRWQLAGDIMRGRHDALLPSNFADRVARAIADDANGAVAVAAAGNAPRLWRWGGGAALAASVAVAALLVIRPEPVALDSAVPATTATAEDTTAADRPALETVAVGDIPGPDATGTPLSAGDVAAAVAVSVPATMAAAAAPAAGSRQSSARSGSAQPSRAAAVAEAPAADASTLVAEARPPVQESVPDAGAIDAVAVSDEPAVADEAAARPWPRAILPGLTDATMAVSAGAFGGEPGGFEGFSPNVVAPSRFWPAQTLPTPSDPVRWTETPSPQSH